MDPGSLAFAGVFVLAAVLLWRSFARGRESAARLREAGFAPCDDEAPALARVLAEGTSGPPGGPRPQAPPGVGLALPLRGGRPHEPGPAPRRRRHRRPPRPLPARSPRPGPGRPRAALRLPRPRVLPPAAP